jgi:MFS family permease
MLDVFALFGLEWLCDRIEDRYGRRAAWLFAFAASLSLLGILLCIVVVVLKR